MARNSSMYGKNIRLTLSKTLIKQYIAVIAVPTCMSYYYHIAQLLLYLFEVIWLLMPRQELVCHYGNKIRYSIKWYEENEPIS